MVEQEVEIAEDRANTGEMHGYIYNYLSIQLCVCVYL